MARQTLRRAPHNDGDRIPGPGLEDVGARALADAAYAEREDDVAVEGDEEVGGEGEEVRLDAGEGLGEAGC